MSREDITVEEVTSTVPVEIRHEELFGVYRWDNGKTIVESPTNLTHSAAYQAVASGRFNGVAFWPQGKYSIIIYTGEPTPEARELLATFPSYGEQFPGGFKLLVKGVLPQNIDQPLGEGRVQVQSKGTFFRFDGDLIPDSPQHVNDCQAALTARFALKKVEEVALRSNPFRAAKQASTLTMGGKPMEPEAIKGLLKKGRLAGIHAQDGDKKTFLLTNLTVSVASGLRWGPYETTQDTVLVVSPELSEYELMERLEHQLDDTFGDDHAARVACKSRIFLVGEDTLEELPDIIRQYKLLAEYAREIGAGLITLDPLFMLHDGDENSPKDMSAVMAAIQRLKKASGCTVFIAHHDNKSGKFAGYNGFSRPLSLRLHATRQGSLSVVTVDKVRGFPQPTNKLTWDILANGALRYHGCELAIAKSQQSEHERILAALQEKDGQTRSELVAKLLIEDRRVGNYLQGLQKDGLVTTAKSRWWLVKSSTETPTN